MKRYTALDEIRGFALISMILYHMIWDLVYLFGMDWKWYTTVWGYLWQQSICWTFIFLSGFCWSLGRRKWQGGMKIFLSGALVTLISFLFAPETRVVFGILSLLGSCMLLMCIFDRVFVKWNPIAGFFISFCLFIVSKNAYRGYLGFGGWRIVRVPALFYRNLFTSYLGFPGKDFYSVDYFPLIPWIFLFIAGYFLYRTVIKLSDGKEVVAVLHVLNRGRLPGVALLGRHSLLIYIIHQPIIYLVLRILFINS